MNQAAFRTATGIDVPAVTADEMREVDRTAVEEVGLSLMQMMEHAGRNLARRVLERRTRGRVVVLAGAGGNGGGGLVCARHLVNRNVPVAVVLDRSPEKIEGATATQLRILDSTDVTIDVETVDWEADVRLVVDALVGYGLRDAPRGTVKDLLRRTREAEEPVISLDVPSGVNATTGDSPGHAVRPDETLTLALPKTGLSELEGELVLGDISVPTAAYERLDIPYRPPFGGEFLVEIEPVE